MIYTSKRRKFKDFVRTHNWKYYFLFLILFVTIVVTVVILSNKDIKEPQNVDETTPVVSESDSANTEEPTVVVKGRYRISVNIANNIVSIYKWDESASDFSATPVKRIPSSTDISLKEGKYTFSKGDVAKNVWYTYDNGDCVRYYSCFGDISFHSSLYGTEGDRNSLIVENYNLISKDLHSDEGIILLCSDAKWIYENCSYASEIVIVNDNTEMVRGEFDSIMSVPEGITWEPTDISENSPYCPTQIGYFNCVYEQFQTIVGAGITVLSPYIKATDVNGNDITSYVYTDFPDRFTEAGVFKVEFAIADIYGTVEKDFFMVTVIDTNNSAEETEKNTEQNTKENAEETNSDSQNG